MRSEPTSKRVSAFFDGQNLFHAAKDAFGYPYPNYDPLALARMVCDEAGWTLAETYFCTGIPDATVDLSRYHFWVAKLAALGTRGVHTFSRTLRYRNQLIALPNGTMTTALTGQEKGVDVRMALDIVRFALEDQYDVALIFSQDQDLSEAVDDVRRVSTLAARWIKCACAFPVSPTYRNARGINRTDWIRIDRAAYDRCLDPADYRRRPPP